MLRLGIAFKDGLDFGILGSEISFLLHVTQTRCTVASVNPFLLKALKLIWQSVKQVDDTRTGEAARALRKKRKMTLKMIGAIIGVTGARISQLERGKDHWRPEFVARYNKALKESEKSCKNATCKAHPKPPLLIQTVKA